MWPLELVMVRHGESEGNVRSSDERALWPMSSPDYQLTQRGIRQAQKTGEYIRKKYGGEDTVNGYNYFDAYYVSYYQRSIQTMAYMFPGVEYRMYEDPRLAEAQRGIYHTLTKDQLALKYPEELIRKDREGLYHYRPPGGENWPDIELRIHSFLGTLARDYAGRRVCMVVHGNWLVLFQRLVHRFSINEAISKYKSGAFENCSITTYTSEVYGSSTSKLGKIEFSRLKLVEENFVPWKKVKAAKKGEIHGPDSSGKEAGTKGRGRGSEKGANADR